MKNPAIQRMVEQMMPEYFERRQRELDKVAALQKKVADLRVYGPRSREDLVTVFALKTGALKLPAGPLYAPETWYDARETTLEKEYQRGLLNLKQIFGNKMPRRDPASRMDVLSPGSEWGYNAFWNGTNTAENFSLDLGADLGGDDIMSRGYKREY